MRRAGMTLIELLIASAIAALLATAVFSLFLIQSRGARGQQNVVDVQDNARIALDQLARDLRNAGFFVTPAAALRIEDDCANTRLSYSGSAWQIGGSGGTQAILAGDNVFTLGNDACPNGSDRITIASRPRSDTASCRNGRADLCAQEPGNNSTIERVPCDLGPCSGGDCSKECNSTLEKIAPGLSSIAPCCGSGNQVLPQPVPVTLCNGNDATQCGAVDVVEVHCCTDAGGGSGAHGSEIQLKLGLPPNGTSFAGDWGVLGSGGHATDPTDIGGVDHRTYQVLDYYHDGGSELVYSDQFYGDAALAATGSSAPASDPQWTVVANGVEDLELAYQFASGATTNTWIDSKSLWDVPSCTPGPNIDCLASHYGATSDPLIAVRVSMVVRSQQIEHGLDSALLVGGRPPLEDNLATPTPGGQGYRRRVVSTIVGLRNLGAQTQ